MNHTHHAKGLRAELVLLLKRVRQVWKLVPRRHKLALGGAALVMALTSACNTAVPLFLGNLVDDVKQGVDAGFSSDQLYRTAGTFLALIAGAYVLREGLNVLRRY